MLHGQRRPTFLNTIHCILERVDLLEVQAVSIIEEHRLETRSEDADRTRADRSREPTFFTRRARSARRMLVRSHRSTERVRDTLFSAARNSSFHRRQCFQGAPFPTGPEIIVH